MTAKKPADSRTFINGWVHDVGHTVHDLEQAAVRRIRGQAKAAEKQPNKDETK